MCDVRQIKSKALTRVKTKKEYSFAIRGPKLFNELPQNMRNKHYPRLAAFKKDLDIFLSSISDQPILAHHHLRAASNSIIDQLALRRADGMYSGGTTAVWITGR